MKVLIRFLSAALLLLAWKPLYADGAMSDGALRYLATTGAATRVALKAGGDEAWLGFTASAGEPAVINVGNNSFSDACSVSAEVFDAAGNLVEQRPCAGYDGHVATLTPPSDGVYKVHLTSRSDSAGSLEMRLVSNGRGHGLVPDTCVIATLALDSTASGSWDAACASVSFSQHYAQYYTFTVPSTQVITINLTSATNTYLVLHSGATQTGVVVATDDDSGPGSNAQIVRSLTAGTYTIEATTSGANQTGSFTLVARTNTTPCFANLKLNRTAYGKWTMDCSSTSFGDHYSKYYTLSVPTDEVVTITLSSSADTYLVLRSGPTQLGGVVATDDNSGAGTNAQIVRTLAAGTYTIEATTSAVNQLGRFTLVARTDDRPCFSKLALDITASSRWTTKCTSVSFGDHYAKYYTISVPTNEVVTVSLSSATDAYLVLRSGPTQLGGVVATDDNSGPGTDAQIVRSLAAGTYTIEATTTGVNQTGDFDLVARTDTAPCFAALPLDTSTPDNWSTDCSSVSFGDHYAKYYTLSVPDNEVVTVTLSSATDAYLVLRSGPTQLGGVVATDDNSGAGTDAQIVRSLTAGTYTIEATTSGASQLGPFTIVARTDTAPCFASIAPSSTVSDSWITACTSVSFADHYAKYYTLSVPASQSISITLTSATNAYLVLRSGPTQLGGVVATDDNSGGGTNAKITRTLAAGVYTIEATTSAANQTGDFSLSIGN